MMPFEEFHFHGHTVPSTALEGLKRYIEQRICPGNFLLAVLENNLQEAVSRANDHVMWELPTLVAYLYNEVPSVAWGSPQKVKDWLYPST